MQRTNTHYNQQETNTSTHATNTHTHAHALTKRQLVDRVLELDVNHLEDALAAALAAVDDAAKRALDLVAQREDEVQHLAAVARHVVAHRRQLGAVVGHLAVDKGLDLGEAARDLIDQVLAELVGEELGADVGQVLVRVDRREKVLRVCLVFVVVV